MLGREQVDHAHQGFARPGHQIGADAGRDLVACGRSITDFDIVWTDLELHKKFLQLPNVAEFPLEDLGAVYAENMTLARCPLRDIVAGHFNIDPKAPPIIRERLEKIYDRAARIHIAKWLQIHEARCLEALIKVGGVKAVKAAA